MKGRPRKGIDELKAKGTYRADRHEKRGVRAEVGAPTMPSWLSAKAKAVWRQTCRQLVELGILSPMDRAILAAYCVAVAELEEATTTLEREGRVLTLPNGCKQAHPCVGQQRSAWGSIKSLGAELGLTPSSREKITREPPPKTDALDEFLKIHSGE